MQVNMHARWKPGGCLKLESMLETPLKALILLQWLSSHLPATTNRRLQGFKGSLMFLQFYPGWQSTQTQHQVRGQGREWRSRAHCPKAAA